MSATEVEKKIRGSTRERENLPPQSSLDPSPPELTLHFLYNRMIEHRFGGNEWQKKERERKKRGVEETRGLKREKRA